MKRGMDEMIGERVRDDAAIDGLGVRDEFDRLLQLREFQYPLAIVAPELQIRRYRTQPRTLGRSRGDGRRITINVGDEPTPSTGVQLDRFDLQEVLLHELVHTYVRQRYGSAPQPHGVEFNRHMDAAFQEAYGPIDVPRRANRYHGRYANALRLRDLERATADVTAQIDEVVSVTPDPFADVPEPNLPISYWFDGVDSTFGEVVGDPIVTTATEHVSTAELDQRVFALIQAEPYQRREFYDREYVRLHGHKYPGKSTYNSIWRLRRDGRVQRFGHHWYVRSV